MSLRDRIEYYIERATNTRIYKTIPRGLDHINDITTFLPNFRARTVFDVGANIGQSAMVYVSQFPESRVHCFEPAGDTFRQLQSNLRDCERVECHRLAFGASTGKRTLVLQSSSDMSFLLQPSQALTMRVNAGTEDVDMITLDEFCNTKHIDRINYLKIDTEGSDLEVLKGAPQLLTEQRIDLVEVEAGMNPNNERHVPFGILKEFLESRQYFLFGIYQQTSEWPTREPHLRRTNPIFISRNMIDMNRTHAEVST